MTTATLTRPYTARILDVLRLFDGCRGLVHFDVRSLSGVSHETLAFRPAAFGSALPAPLLDALEQGDAVRFSPATHDGGRAVDLPMLSALFQLAPHVDHHSRSFVEPEAQAKIRDALAAFPLAPAFLIDAAHEVVAAWPLDHPLAVDHDRAHALALLSRLAERLGADAGAGADPSALPLAGVVRGFGMLAPVPWVEIVEVDARHYTLADVEAALMPSTPETETPKRKGARS